MREKNLCIIQVRYGSTRLPGKVLKKVKGLTLLEYEIRRVGRAKKIDKVVIATTINKADDEIEALSKKMGVDCFRGSEADVLDRYYRCSSQYPEYKNIIRITGDCPLIDPEIIDQVVDLFEKNDFDYASNVDPATFPDGLDVEVFKKSALEKAAQMAKLLSEREHVTQSIRKNPENKKGNYRSEKDYSNYRLTVDEPKDFEVIEFIITKSRPDASYLDYIALLNNNPLIREKNKHINRNEGLEKSLREDKYVNK